MKYCQGDQVSFNRSLGGRAVLRADLLIRTCEMIGSAHPYRGVSEA